MKKSMLIGTGFAAAVGLQFADGVIGDYVSESSDSETLVIDMQYASEATEEQRQSAKNALENFIDSCPHVDGVFKSRITEPEIRLIDSMPYREESYGWPWEVHLKFIVDNDDRTASGHTLDYYIWTDGWVVQKAQGAEFCGKEPEHMKDTYVGFEKS